MSDPIDTKKALRQMNLAHPFTVRSKMLQHHGEFDLEAEQAALLRDIRVGTLDFLSLYHGCMQTAGPEPNTAVKFLARPLKALMLLRCFERALQLHPRAPFIECGVFRGFSALLLARVARERLGGFDGSAMFLLDSFEGLAAPSDEDTVVMVDEAAGGLRMASPPLGFSGTSSAHVAQVLGEFPEATICKGWIPAAFAQLPDERWSFVHVDVDLFQPTLRCLEYFHQRLLPGGIIVCDDYVTPFYPGAMLAWDEFCAQRGLHFLILDSGQAVLTRA